MEASHATASLLLSKDTLYAAMLHMLDCRHPGTQLILTTVYAASYLKQTAAAKPAAAQIHMLCIAARWLSIQCPQHASFEFFNLEECAHLSINKLCLDPSITYQFAFQALCQGPLFLAWVCCCWGCIAAESNTVHSLPEQLEWWINQASSIWCLALQSMWGAFRHFVTSCSSVLDMKAEMMGERQG